MAGSNDVQVQRAGRRAPFDGWVELQAGGMRRRASGRDLSVHGIGIALSAPLPEVAAPVVSEFALPGIGVPLWLEGVVVWADPASSRLGVRFNGVEPGLAELLDNFVNGRL